MTKKTATEKRLGGRPSEYQSHYPAQAEKLCRLGAIDADLGEFFEVGEVAINAWKKRTAAGFAQSRGNVSNLDMTCRLGRSSPGMVLSHNIQDSA